MIRTIITYGAISGAVIIAGMIAAMTVGGGHSSLLTGYLIMLVALSAILLGVKQHRDRELGGVIKFGAAFLVGLGIALAASITYVAIWELYLASTHYTFMDKYTDAMLAGKRAAGVTGAAYAKAVAEAAKMRSDYANPLYRLPETFIEIFPVAFLVALVSAALVRNPKFLPARSRPA